MATAFLSRSERAPLAQVSDGPGPGGPVYDPRSIENSVQLPGFVGFGASAKREALGKFDDDMPGPGSYVMDSNALYSKKGGAPGLKSKTKRFEESRSIDEPGPGSYVLKSTIKEGAPKKFAKPSSNVIEKLENIKTDSLAIAGLSSSSKGSPLGIPSIPTKFQSYGYESNNLGHLVLQEPLIPGFAGTKDDAVGPGDYNPKVDFRFRSAPAAGFGKGDRPSLGKMADDGPGPGQYNVHSDFDLLARRDNGKDNDFVLRLHAAKVKLSAAFESKTQRDSIMKEALQKVGPGPGKYSIPSTIRVTTKPPEKQFFSSAEERFKDPLPRSMRSTTAPGSYDPRTSDFDNAKLKILKQKQIASRSGWAQNISFSATEQRFHAIDNNKEIPPPGTYRPKNEFKDLIGKPNRRAGPFGGSSKRFEEEKPTYIQRSDSAPPPMLDGRGGGGGFGGGHVQSQRPMPGNQRIGGAGPGGANGSMRPKFSSVFATKTERLPKEKGDDGPPPGAYYAPPSWKAPGAIPMKESMKWFSRKKAEHVPGPGQYNIATKLGDARPNRKNVMLSTAKRDGLGVSKQSLEGPGPCAYSVSTSLIRPSYNIMLASPT